MTKLARKLASLDYTCIDRGVYLEPLRTLVVSDLHLGVLGTHNAQLTASKLVTLAQVVKATRVICLGDLFDHKASLGLLDLGVWLYTQLPQFELVMGNHDWEFLDHYQQIGIHTYEVLTLNDISLSHFPIKASALLHGHLHPQNPDRRPSYLISPTRVCLPCFNVELTRGRVITPREDQELVLVETN